MIVSSPRFSHRHTLAGPTIFVGFVAALFVGCGALMPGRSGVLAALAVIAAAVAVLVGPRQMRSGG